MAMVGKFYSRDAMLTKKDYFNVIVDYHKKNIFTAGQTLQKLLRLYITSFVNPQSHKLKAKVNFWSQQFFAKPQDQLYKQSYLKLAQDCLRLLKFPDDKDHVLS